MSSFSSARELFSKYVAPHRRLLGVVLALNVCVIALTVATPWVVKILVDNVIGQLPLWGRVLGSQWLVILSLSYIALEAVSAYLQSRAHYFLTAAVEKSALSLQEDLFSRVMALPLSRHQGTPITEFSSRIIDDVDRLKSFFVDTFLMLCQKGLIFFAMAVVMLQADWQLATLAIMTLLPLGALFVFFPQMIAQTAIDVRQGEMAQMNHVVESLQLFRLIKISNREGWERNRFLKFCHSRIRAWMKITEMDGIYQFLVLSVTGIGFAVVIGFGGSRVLAHKLSLGELLVFLQYLTALHMPLKQLGRLAGTGRKAIINLRQVDEILRMAPDTDAVGVPAMPPVVRGSITISELSFQYASEKEILSDVDLEIGAGEHIGIVGPTGAGKTSLLSLLAGLYSPKGGEIYLDGVPYSELPRRVLREHVSVCLQEPYIVAGSIRDNIIYGSKLWTENHLQEVLRVAQLEPLVRSLPQGLDTDMGVSGARFSGGEKQRICLARALLRRTPVLLLDEPTSAMDALTESRLIEGLSSYLRGTTVLFVTHRPALLALATRILRVEHGDVGWSGRGVWGSIDA